MHVRAQTRIHDLKTEDVSWDVSFVCLPYAAYARSAAQGGGGSFKDRKPIGEVGSCDAWMAAPWWTKTWSRL
jgi:hypothetical protein